MSSALEISVPPVTLHSTAFNMILILVQELTFQMFSEPPVSHVISPNVLTALLLTIVSNVTLETFSTQSLVLVINAQKVALTVIPILWNVSSVLTKIKDLTPIETNVLTVKS